LGEKKRNSVIGKVRDEEDNTGEEYVYLSTRRDERKQTTGGGIERGEEIKERERVILCPTPA